MTHVSCLMSFHNILIFREIRRKKQTMHAARFHIINRNDNHFFLTIIGEQNPPSLFLTASFIQFSPRSQFVLHAGEQIASIFSLTWKLPCV